MNDRPVLNIAATLSPQHAAVLKVLVDAMVKAPKAAVVVVLVANDSDQSCATKLLGSFNNSDAIAAGEQVLEWAARDLKAACSCESCRADHDILAAAIAGLGDMYQKGALH